MWSQYPAVPDDDFQCKQEPSQFWGLGQWGYNAEVVMLPIQQTQGSLPGKLGGVVVVMPYSAVPDITNAASGL